MCCCASVCMRVYRCVCLGMYVLVAGHTTSRQHIREPYNPLITTLRALCCWYAHLPQSVHHRHGHLLQSGHHRHGHRPHNLLRVSYVCVYVFVCTCVCACVCVYVCVRACVAPVCTAGHELVFQFQANSFTNELTTLCGPPCVGHVPIQSFFKTLRGKRVGLAGLRDHSYHSKPWHAN